MTNELKIVIKNPEQYRDEYVYCMEKAIETLHKQSRSAARYAKKLQWWLNRAKNFREKF